MSKKVRKSLAVLAAFVLMISFIAGNDAFTNVYAQEAGTETASEQITSTTEQKAVTESNTEAAKAESTASVSAIQKKTAVKSVKQASEPAVTNGDFSKYLTKFAFTDHLGNAFTESHPVTKDSNVIIRYEFKIPNVFHLDGLSGVAQKLNNQQAGAVEEVPNWTVNNNATITIKFPKTLTQSNIEGFMEISCSVDADKLKEETIIFDLGQLEGFGQEYRTDYEPEVTKKNPGVTKKGALNREDQTITWTVNATPDKGDNNLEGYILTDTFDKKQVFVKGSMELDGTKTADPELSDNGWNYKFGKISNGSHTLTYKTKLTDEFFETDYKSSYAKDMSASAANAVTIKTGDGKGEASANASVQAGNFLSQ